MTAAGAIIRLLSVSRATIYKYVPEGTTGRAAAALPPDRSNGPCYLAPDAPSPG